MFAGHIQLVGKRIPRRPPGHLRARLLQRDGVESADQPSLLGDTQELSRSQQAPGRVRPADQGLEAGRGVGGAVDDRLEVHRDLFSIDRLAQLALERHLFDQELAHALVEDLDTISAAFLGPVHRGVGVAQQLIGCHLPRITHRNADAERRMDGCPVVDVGSGKRRSNAFGNRHGLRHAGEVVAQHDELIATKPGNGVVDPDCGFHPFANVFDEPVSDVVAERVVDHLEPVDIDEHDADERLLTGIEIDTRVQRGAEPVHEHRPVGKPGQFVVQRLFGEFPGRIATEGDVLRLCTRIRPPSLFSLRDRCSSTHTSDSSSPFRMRCSTCVVRAAPVMSLSSAAKWRVRSAGSVNASRDVPDQIVSFATYLVAVRLVCADDDAHLVEFDHTDDVLFEVGA